MSTGSSKTPLVLNQISARLHDIFDGLIDLSDVKNKKKDEKDQYFVTRSYAALSLINEAGVTPSDAAASITDGGADDGIDLVYVDEKNARIYFGQSKWRSNMSKGVELNDFTRFRDGVKNVLQMNWNAGNANLHRFKNKIERQLHNIDTDVVMILAHTSEQAIAENIQLKITDFLAEENKYTAEFVIFKEFQVSQATKVARSHTRPENINVPVMLANWGVMPKPYKAVYGAVSGLDVIDWYEAHGNKLFAENLRYAIEKSDVNEGIMSTADTYPDNFWYFNNGITAICDRVEKAPLGGADTASGIFQVDKISVINGAQTISSLHKAKKSGSDLKHIKVHLRIISLAETPEGFAAAVTSANNTQNDLNPVDFVAVDPNQERIRKEAAQIGVIYTFRRGDKEPDRDAGFTIRTATVAQACASGDLRLAVAAKRYISGLWENTKKEPYTRLFNETTTAAHLWAVVRILYSVDDKLAQLGQSLSGKDKLVSVHGNRFIAFCVYRNLDLEKIDDPCGFEQEKISAVKITEDILNGLITAVAKMFPDAYPGNIFKNVERQAELIKQL